MSHTAPTFQTIDAINNHIASNLTGAIIISYANLDEYPGMARALSIIFDTSKTTYDLSVEWMSLGLDLYGDTLQECYIYRFPQIENVLLYLETTYQIKINDIPIKFHFDQNDFPNPIKDEDKKVLFETIWNRFQTDFITGIFLDNTQQLIFSSTAN